MQDKFFVFRGKLEIDAPNVMVMRFDGDGNDLRGRPQFRELRYAAASSLRTGCAVA